MSVQPEGTEWDTPCTEVRVLRHGKLLKREMCESDAEVEQVLAAWSEIEEATCQVDNLSFHHLPGDVLAPDPAVLSDDPFHGASTARLRRLRHG